MVITLDKARVYRRSIANNTRNVVHNCGQVFSFEVREKQGAEEMRAWSVPQACACHILSCGGFERTIGFVL